MFEHFIITWKNNYLEARLILWAGEEEAVWIPDRHLWPYSYPTGLWQKQKQTNKKLSEKSW